MTCRCNRKRNSNRNCDKNCDEKDNECKKIIVGFIDTFDGALVPTQPYIDKAMAMNAFPNICKVEYQFIPNFVPSDDPVVQAANIRAQVDLVEAAVLALWTKGVKYVVLGGKSTFMAPLTTGDANTTNLKGLNEQQRYPSSDMFFGYAQLGAGAQAYIDLLLSNCTGQIDRNTPALPLAEDAVKTYTNGGIGQVYFVYQDGDLASTTQRDLYATAAGNLGVTFIQQAIGPLSSDFATQIANTVVPFINANLGPNDVVMFAVNGDSDIQEALVLAINAAPAITSGSRIFGANFGPVKTPLKYDVFVNQSNIFPYFSPFLISLGYSNSPSFSTDSLPNFIETMGYFNAMACLKPWAGTDGTARYDVFKNLVNPLIVNQVIKAGDLLPTTINAVVNPVWTQTINTTVAFPV